MSESADFRLCLFGLFGLCKLFGLLGLMTCWASAASSSSFACRASLIRQAPRKAKGNGKNRGLLRYFASLDVKSGENTGVLLFWGPPAAKAKSEF
eukprot:11511063-Prorocentrum_lima.AAC.2